MLLVSVVVVKNINVVVENKMVIILKRIPSNTRKKDIIEYLAPVLKGKVFQKTGAIEKIQMLALKNSQTEDIDLYGVVYIDSDEAAKRVIKKLNRKVFKGKNIAINEYINRSWHNDSRLNSLELGDKQQSKRKLDRRRSSLQKIKALSISFSSHDSFHRK